MIKILKFLLRPFKFRELSEREKKIIHSILDKDECWLKHSWIGRRGYGIDLKAYDKCCKEKGIENVYHKQRKEFFERFGKYFDEE